MDTHEVKGAVRSAAGKVEQTYGRIKDTVSKTADEITDSRTGELASERSIGQALALVQENPGTAIGVSLLVGAGLGALIAYLASD